MGRARPVSASAIRNQENGTNGIPMNVAEAYAKVLKVDVMWLLFGRTTDDRAESDDAPTTELDEIEGEWTLADLSIGKYGVISANWLPEMVSGTPSGDEGYLWILVEGWSGTGARLLAYEVADHSLEPTYSRGTWLIVANAHEAHLTNGCHVVCSRMRGQEMVQAVRELRRTREEVTLVPMGVTGGKPMTLIDGEKRAKGVWVDGVVIATFKHAVAPTGPGIVLPEELIFGPAADPTPRPGRGVLDWTRDRQAQVDEYLLELDEADEKDGSTE